MAESTRSRTERDSMGAIEVPDERYWGAQTQRSLENFRIGGERMPLGAHPRARRSRKKRRRSRIWSSARSTSASARRSSKPPMK